LGRLTITNDLKIYTSILSQDKKGGFINFIKEKHNNIWMIVTKKKRNPVYNYYKLPNDDYVVCAGTIIYRELFGKEALQAIYKDFNEKIEPLRENALYYSYQKRR